MEQNNLYTPYRAGFLFISSLIVFLIEYVLGKKNHIRIIKNQKAYNLKTQFIFCI